MGVGIVTVGISAGYPIGTTMRMGPGYFPRYVGILLSVLGGVITLSSLRVEGEEIRRFGWRPIVMLSLGFIVFAWAIDRVGFVPSMAAMIVCSMLAGRKFKWLEVLVMCVVLITGSVALFIYGLKLPLSLFWW